MLGWTWSERNRKLSRQQTLATRAATLDDSDPWAHLALGYVAFTRRHTEEAVQQFQRAIDLNPNFAAAHGYFGLALALDGQSDRAIPHLEQAIRMSPHDPQNAIFFVGLAAAHYLTGQYSEAVNFGRRAVQHRSTFTGGHRILCASLAQAGQSAEARVALQRLKELQPEISTAWIRNTCPIPKARWQNSSKACAKPDWNEPGTSASLEDKILESPQSENVRYWQIADMG